jgi:hypothetical protein
MPRPVLRNVARVLFGGLLCAAAFLGTAGSTSASAQTPDTPLAKTGGSSNVRVLGHLPFNGRFSISGVDIEQELSRPYAYVSGFADQPGFYVVDVADPAWPMVIYQGQPPLS